MKKFLKFEQSFVNINPVLWHKKPVYYAFDRKGVAIAQVFWYAPWEKWTARFLNESVWNKACLDELAMFMRGLADDKTKNIYDGGH